MEDDAVYAAILARVARPELDAQLQQVQRREARAVSRQLRRADASLAALRQLQAAAQWLRPGDWQPASLASQLRALEQLQRRLDAAVEQLGDRPRKRQRPQKEKEKEEKEKEEKETGSQEEEKSGKGTEESHQLPFGLERRTREQVQIKQEVAPFSEDEQTTGGDTLQEVGEAESPLELSLMDSSEEDEPLGLEPEADETPIELEVPDSDSDTDFTPFQERLKKLQKANAATQLIEFPSVVEQFRDYLFKEKHMTVAELDGYLFAHKRITEEEVDEMGRAIETLISVGMNLATRPKIKLALFDLLAAVEQLEQTLGALPVSLKSLTSKLSSQFLSQLEENAATRNCEARFAVMHM